MSTSRYDNYDLFKAVDTHITRPRFSTQREIRFYPSEASIEVFDKFGDKTIHGGCLRASYFRLSGDYDGIPNNARTEYIFEQGIAVEKILVNLYKEMGIWVNNNVKFVDLDHNISGELDVILKEPDGRLYGGEIKSFYGYFAEKEIFGNKSQAGFPKMGQLLQTLIYLNHFEKQLPYFRMIYFARDSVKRRTFKIELHHEGNISYPMVEGDVIRSFSVDDIYRRYGTLQAHLDAKTIPERDFDLQYSDEKIRDFFKKGKVAKTKYAKWETGKLPKGELIGDWQCAWCRWKDICYRNK